MIDFNRPPYTGHEDAYVLEAMKSEKISGDGVFGRRCQDWFIEQLGCKSALLTPSCTQALEMAALLLEIEPGDEVIMPSYTFVSTANAFVLRGARIVFVDIEPETMNLNAGLIEQAITKRTRAIVPVHYAGIGCDMAVIMEIAERYELWVVEDAAQAMMSTRDGRPLGTFGHLGAFSFHETKNFTSGGEGGLLIINDARFADRAEIIREKGTNRSAFFRGMVDKYTWISLGSSYLPSEIQAAYLWAQLEQAESIQRERLRIWKRYDAGLTEIAASGRIDIPIVPESCRHNGHIFFVKANDRSERDALLGHLKDQGIMGVFHYVPLHSAPAGQAYGRFAGEDIYTTRESERLIRLPIWHGLSEAAQDRIVASVRDFYSGRDLNLSLPVQDIDEPCRVAEN